MVGHHAQLVRYKHWQTQQKHPHMSRKKYTNARPTLYILTFVPHIDTRKKYFHPVTSLMQLWNANNLTPGLSRGTSSSPLHYKAKQSEAIQTTKQIWQKSKIKKYNTRRTLEKAWMRMNNSDVSILHPHQVMMQYRNINHRFCIMEPSILIHVLFSLYIRHNKVCLELWA